MGEPRDTNRAHISPAAARRVLVAIDTEDTGDSGSREGKAYPQIAGYTIERELGRGAGGVTYLAHMAGSEAKIALKVLHAHQGDGRASQRAWRELDTLQQVRVPSVPRLLDFGTTDHSLYIATEYIEGTPLSELYAHARPADLAEMRERVRLLERIARAAHSLHERGVIHRDLKPSNVIVAPAGPHAPGDRAHATPGRADDAAERPGAAAGRADDAAARPGAPAGRAGAADNAGEPFIIDLGIALIDAPDLHQTLTQDGQPVGTPAFMAPEQARGRHEEISTRSDIYSLGAIGYWLCTGETPHDLTGVTLHEAIRRVGSEPAREARGISTGVPKALGAVLGKACAGRPLSRYASAAALADDLSRWIGGMTVSAGRSSPWHRFIELVLRHPLIATASLCLMMLGASAMGSVLFAAWMSNAPFSMHYDEPTGTSTLRSPSGRELRTFMGGPFEYPAAHLVSDPRIPGQQLLIARLDRFSPDPSLEGQLAIGPLTVGAAPLWTTDPIEPGFGAPPSPWTNQGETYGAGPWTHADVFPQNPGEELIVAHTQPNHPTKIRIYSLAGETLFEAWHFGSVAGLVWVPRAELLVVACCDGTHPLDGADPDALWPFALSAVAPGYRASWGWINGPDADPAAVVLWYKHIVPYELAARVVPKPQVRSNLPANADFEVVLRLRSDLRAQANWHITREGDILPPSPNSSPGDIWQRTNADFPIHALGLQDP